MAFVNRCGSWFLGWRHHPVRVGRLMPTLIRTRRIPRARNMLRRLCHKPRCDGLRPDGQAREVALGPWPDPEDDGTRGVAELQIVHDETRLRRAVHEQP